MRGLADDKVIYKYYFLSRYISRASLVSMFFVFGQCALAPRVYEYPERILCILSVILVYGAYAFMHHISSIVPSSNYIHASPGEVT